MPNNREVYTNLEPNELVSINELKTEGEANINPNDLWKLSVYLQAEYADDICKQSAVDAQFCIDSFDKYSKMYFTDWKVNTIGNIAYLSLHSYSNMLKNNFEKLLTDYYDWHVQDQIKDEYVEQEAYEDDDDVEQEEEHLSQATHNFVRNVGRNIHDDDWVSTRLNAIITLEHLGEQFEAQVKCDVFYSAGEDIKIQDKMKLYLSEKVSVGVYNLVAVKLPRHTKRKSVYRQEFARINFQKLIGWCFCPCLFGLCCVYLSNMKLHDLTTRHKPRAIMIRSQQFRFKEIKKIVTGHSTSSIEHVTRGRMQEVFIPHTSLK